MLFDVPEKESSIIKVIGVGGGGSNAVSHMFERGIKGVDFAICNTDNQSLESMNIPVKIGLGPNLTEGRGAGSKPEIGKQACIESIDDIRKFLENGTKMVFITAGMGGGTGTGAAPIIAKVAQELDILTVGICTLPFGFEGVSRQRHAVEGLEEFKKYVDAILVISNDKLKDLFGDLKLSDAFGHADEILTTAAKGIAEIITVSGQINVDFADVDTVMRSSGVAIMGSAALDGDERARKTVEAALNYPLLKDNDIRGAKHILLNITTSPEFEVTMSELNEITGYIQDEAGYGTTVIFGTCHDDTLGEKLSITLIATGFHEDAHKDRLADKPAVRIALDASEEEALDNEIFDIGVSEGAASNTIEFEDVVFNTNAVDPVDDAMSETNRKMEVELERKREEMDRVRRDALLSGSKRSLEDPEHIKNCEKIPAYQRRNVTLDDFDHSSVNPLSRYTVSMDDENPEIKSNNSFLHDNVD